MIISRIVGRNDGAREKERRGKTRSTSTDFLLTCYFLVRFTPTMDVGRRQEEKEGRKEGMEEVGMENRDLTPWPSHGCDILPYLVPCSPTLVEFTWKGNPSFLYLLTRVVRVLVTRREHRRATTSPRRLSCSPGIPHSRANHRVDRANQTFAFRLSSYEKMLRNGRVSRRVNSIDPIFLSVVDCLLDI